MKRPFVLFLILALLVLGACSKSPTGSIVIDTTKPREPGYTFTEMPGEVCMEDGKPIIRLFATSWCPHCQWIKDTYIRVGKEYVDQGAIKALLWEIDKETVPEEEKAIFSTFNPKGSIPTFVFGCKYARIGNAFEEENNLEAEEAEFRAIIEKLINKN